MNVGKEFVALYDSLDSESHGAGDRMRLKGVAARNVSVVGSDNIEDVLVYSTAERGMNPPPRDLPMVCKSGPRIDSCCQACWVPLRYMPHMTYEDVRRCKVRGETSEV